MTYLFREEFVELRYHVEIGGNELSVRVKYGREQLPASHTNNVEIQL
jgi:hypothetical protein